jgi:DNA-binding response OmpR family regulator
LSKILLVDENKTYRDTLRAALRCRGHQVWLARSIQDVAQIVRHHAPLELVILDWFLPDGLAPRLIGWLRESGSTAPILALVAAEAFDRVQSQAEQRGATVALNKSMSLQQVQGIVERFLAAQGDPACALQLGRNTVRRLEYPFPSVALPPAQQGLFQVLMEQPPGQFISAAALAGRLIVYAHRTDTSRLIAKRVSRLRRRLAPLGVLIESRRGQGYRLVVVPLPASRDGGR